ncbi:MAG: MoaD/ThiS family protein [Actinomycetota bacterium]
MHVSVVCFGAMREYLPATAGGNRAQVEVPEKASVGEVVDALGAPRSLVFSLLVDGVHADLSRVLHDGAEVTLMPPFAGGARGPAAR